MTPDETNAVRTLVREEVAAVREEVASTEARLTKHMRDMQSEILRGLERFARGNFARMHRLEVSDQDLSERINAFEERVLALETRPPQP
jgi:hypothetical protein